MILGAKRKKRRQKKTATHLGVVARSMAAGCGVAVPNDTWCYNMVASCIIINTDSVGVFPRLPLLFPTSTPRAFPSAPMRTLPPPHPVPSSSSIGQNPSIPTYIRQLVSLRNRKRSNVIVINMIVINYICLNYPFNRIDINALCK